MRGANVHDMASKAEERLLRMPETNAPPSAKAIRGTEMTEAHDIDDTMRMIADTMHKSREDAFNAAIELCEALARDGHSAECCVQALRDFKAQLPASPSAQN